MAGYKGYGYDEGIDADSYSDIGEDDYDDFVVPVQKKNQGRKPPGHTATKNQQQVNIKTRASDVSQAGSARKKDVGGNIVKPKAAASKDSTVGTLEQSKVTNSIPSLNIVVCGRVDVGKSTLLGHLLSLLGAVDSKTIRNGELAWILDQGEDERRRGITIDPTKASAIIALNHVPKYSKKHGINTFNRTVDHSTADPTKTGAEASCNSECHEEADSLPSYIKYDRIKVNFIDTPGHHDLVSNLVKGAVFASTAVVIVDIGDFMKEDTNAYFEQHMFMLWSLGMRHFIVCINKVDRINAKDIYGDAVKLLKERTSLYGSDITLIDVPTSGLKGLNLVQNDIDWYGGPCLLEALQIVSAEVLKLRQSERNAPRDMSDKAESKSNTSVLHASDKQTYGVVCHIFDLWEESKTQLGCTGFLETTVRVPCKLVSLPSETTVMCSQLAIASPAHVTAAPYSNSADNIPGITIKNSSFCYSQDFADCMTLKGQEITAVTGDRLMVDQNDLYRIKAGSGPLVEATSVNCRVYVPPCSRHKLTLGSSLDVYVGSFHVGAALVSLREYLGQSKWKRVTSLWPGKEGVLTLKVNSPIYVHTIPLNCFESLHPSHIENRSHFTGDGGLLAVYMPLLSRILIRFCGDVVGGGIVVDSSPT
ncbi:translation factor like protein [Babesia gibsoni]|uniref:Translation factor like protein n=1 Tax=Babesia gibsoni TaxID=33632 RepID=A0AAD8PFR0_BABGI|nr:translation factor like protein [Babesia gibsoni]